MERKEVPEDLDFEIVFYEGLIEEDPNFVPALIPLADDYTKVGRYEDGLALDERLSRLRPNDPIVHYNLACSYALTNKARKAIASLRRAVHLGYNDLEWIEEDADLASIRSLKGYTDIIASLKSKKSPPS